MKTKTKAMENRILGIKWKQKSSYSEEETMKNTHILIRNRTQHIYITSDEEIKFNDYITDGYFVWQWKDDSSLLGRKKIILTTDKYLTKDGVQAIDDDYLEWFVNNLK